MNLAHFMTAVLRSVRFLVVTFVCTLVIFSSAYPAFAISSDRSKPSEGEARLNEIFENSQDALRPENALSGEKVKNQANRGLNEVQGAGDVQQMNTPSDSQKATSAAEQAENVLEKAKDKVLGRN